MGDEADRSEQDASRATILVVDDEILARQTLQDLLETRGFDVLTLARGEEVFGWLDDVDLVLLDAMLPGRDGWSICEEIKQAHDPLMPVIMVTARTTSDDVVRTFAAGADDYVAKPFEMAELTARIESRLRAYRVEQALKEANRQLADLADQNYRLYDQARRDADERSRLLREIDHRVRNNLSVIMGLVSIERNRRPLRPTDDALASLENRLRSFLMVHDALRRRNYAGVPMHEIAQRMLQRVRSMQERPRAIRIDVRGDELLLNERQGFSFALALNELVMNTFQHAFPDQRDGSVVIEFGLDESTVRIDVIDDGIGFDHEDRSDILGSGHSIVRALVERETGGRVEFLPAARGTHVRISFPREEPPPPPSTTGARDNARSPTRGPASYTRATRAPSPR